MRGLPHQDPLWCKGLVDVTMYLRIYIHLLTKVLDSQTSSHSRVQRGREEIEGFSMEDAVVTESTLIESFPG
jgi:hypothetical protein